MAPGRQPPARQHPATLPQPSGLSRYTCSRCPSAAVSSTIRPMSSALQDFETSASLPHKLRRARATEGHPCLTALRRPWLRADRRRLALTSLSRQPATTLGCPPIPHAGGRDGCTSVVEAERSRTAQRGFADPREDRDVAARLSEGSVPASRAAGQRRGNATGDAPEHHLTRPLVTGW